MVTQRIGADKVNNTNFLLNMLKENEGVLRKLHEEGYNKGSLEYPVAESGEGVSHEDMPDIPRWKFDLVEGHPRNEKKYVRYDKGSIRTCEAQVLYSLIRKNKYKDILDIGTGNGFSILYFSKALKDEGLSGHIDTVDIVDKREERSLGQLFDRFDLEEYITFHVGDSAEVIEKMEKEYDFVLIDGSHTYEQTKRDFEAVISKVRKGGCVVFHDVYKTPEGVSGVRTFVDEVSAMNLGEVHFFNKEIFDFFSYQEDIEDYIRMKNKWHTKQYSYVKEGSDARELMGVFFKS